MDWLVVNGQYWIRWYEGNTVTQTVWQVVGDMDGYTQVDGEGEDDIDINQGRSYNESLYGPIGYGEYTANDLCRLIASQ